MSVDVNVLAEALVKALTQIQQQAQPIDEYELASEPFKEEVEEEEVSDLERYILRADSSVERKSLIPFKTGTFLDDLFYNENDDPLGGIPAESQIAITGLPDAGKSILIEEIAIKTTNYGRKVLYVTGEDIWISPSQRFDLQSRLKQKCEILGLDWNKVKENLFVLDVVGMPELREWKEFALAYRYTCERYKIELVLIDSITVLETYRGALKYRVFELCVFNQKNGITAIFVNQRANEKAGKYEMAGGIGLPHNFDGTIIVDYETVYYNEELKRQLGLKRGDFVRYVRVLGCRLCNFNRDYIQVDITSDGFLRRK